MANLGKYKYPLTVQNSGLYLQFVMYDYAKAQNIQVGDLRDFVTDSSRVVESTTDFFTNLPQSIQNIFSGSNREEGTVPQTKEPSGSYNVAHTSIGNIFLYLPPKLEYTYGAEWNRVSFGVLGAAISDSSIDVGGIVGAAASSGANLLFNNGQEALEGNVPKLENVSLDSVLGAAFGVTFNDNTIQNFNRMNTRSFNFDYLLVARNSEEENEIKRIIKVFKLAMHPKSTVSGRNNSLLLEYPYVFRIIPSGYLQNKSSEYGSRISKFLPATRYCALNRFTVDYTPDNVLALTPGEFVQAVRISLGFIELTPLTREDIDQWEDTTSLS